MGSSLSTVEILFHALLVYINFNKKSAIIFVFVSLYVISMLGGVLPQNFKIQVKTIKHLSPIFKNLSYCLVGRTRGLSALLMGI